MGDDQLSQHERTVLEALEESLGLDDPAFVERFTAEARALDAASGRGWNPLRWLHRRRNRQPDL